MALRLRQRLPRMQLRSQSLRIAPLRYRLVIALLELILLCFHGLRVLAPVHLGRVV